MRVLRSHAPSDEHRHRPRERHDVRQEPSAEPLRPGGCLQSDHESDVRRIRRKHNNRKAKHKRSGGSSGVLCFVFRPGNYCRKVRGTFLFYLLSSADGAQEVRGSSFFGEFGRKACGLFKLIFCPARTAHKRYSRGTSCESPAPRGTVAGDMVPLWNPLLPPTGGNEVSGIDRERAKSVRS